MEIDKELYFTLHSSIIPVKGFTQSIICDLQKNNYIVVSNDLCKILLDNDNVRIKNVYSQFSIGDHKVLDEMFKFLFDKNYIFLSKEPSNITKLNFNKPFYSEEINNAIIDVNSNSNILSIKKFINEINLLGCKNLSIRFFGNQFKQDKIASILNFLLKTTIRYTELTIHNDIFKPKEINELIDNNIRLNTIFVYSSIKEKVIEYDGKKIIHTKLKNIDSNSCGKIDKKYFFSDTNMFSLNKNVNSCLFGKVSLTVNGEIVNCPSLKPKYGKINDITIKNVLQKDEFKELWSINKDQIKVCKDCEFRYICSDCRAYLNNKYDKPFKCNYDPYVGKWEK
ncbi:MAG: grasp-with-spasm system SPASM domain peptide maturase [Flavobacteriaceae bacterium]|nr:grasp-with-spasm system SPASM domain peptide maturase [Flavobacteriaceae bacterium]